MSNTKAEPLNGINKKPDSALTDAATSQRDEILSFHLAEEEYAVDILRVQEIRGWGNITPIPRMPDYVKGVINLRGAVVPVIDLRLRFGLQPIEYGPTTVIIIVAVFAEQKKRDMGIVVDAVSDVYALESDEIKPPPDFGNNVEGSFLRGLITKDERMIIVLDIDRVLNSGELALLRHMQQSNSSSNDGQ